ncbi:unnamed protein product, partial [Rotaria sp. Silwood2]
TISSFAHLFRFVRTSIQLNQYITNAPVNGILTVVLNNGTMSTHCISNTYWGNARSCVTSVSCVRSEGFYCRKSFCMQYWIEPFQKIPGLFVSCLLVDSLLASSLKCFYNASCIQMLIKWRSFDSSSFTADSRIMNVTALDPTIHSRFSPDMILDKIISQLFIEDWTTSTNYSSYYNTYI